MAIGTNRKNSSTLTNSDSMSGASHRPARKPRITVGSAPISSMAGLTISRMRGRMK
jgi:hypothetical protein